MADIKKMRQAVDRQLEAINALSGAVLREVFDFEEEKKGHPMREVRNDHRKR